MSTTTTTIVHPDGTTVSCTTAATEAGAPRKKVLVSGCFDLLHSGHVQFFKEASELGDLYVRLGTDANIKALKNHLTIYNDEERLFMVRAIKWVHDAEMSAGTGVYDFEEDFKIVKPDIYFCNEDASKMDGRVKICTDLGIEMVVKPRNPAEGLAVRSSTDMKARLRETVKREETEKALMSQAELVATCHETFPWRFCFAGGWMDLSWCNELYPGCVVTINLKFSPKVCKDMCGLATSSRKHAIKLWNGNFPSHLEAVDAAAYLWGSENFDYFGNEAKSYRAGSQDHCGLFFPGINKLCYDGRNWPTSVIQLNDPSDPAQAQVFKWLESVLWVVDIPFVSRPPDFNSQRINHIKDVAVPKETKVAMIKALSETSEAAWNAILAMDAAALGKALTATMAAWGVMLPYTLDPYLASDGYPGDPNKSKELKEFWTKYDNKHEGCLFSGAGGGFLMVISTTPVEDAMQITLNHDHYCKPYPSMKIGDEPRVLPR